MHSKPFQGSPTLARRIPGPVLRPEAPSSSTQRLSDLPGTDPKSGPFPSNRTASEHRNRKTFEGARPPARRCLFAGNPHISPRFQEFWH